MSTTYMIGFFQSGELVFNVNNYSSFKYMYRKTAREFSLLASREIHRKINSKISENGDLVGKFVTFTDDIQFDLSTEDKMILHMYMINNDECITFVTDGHYNVPIIWQVVKKIVSEDSSSRENIAKEFVNMIPDKKDKIADLKLSMDEVKNIMTKNIETVIERGEHIDDLVAKSDDLSMKSKHFYKATRKLNRNCCIIS